MIQTILAALTLTLISGCDTQLVLDALRPASDSNATQSTSPSATGSNPTLSNAKVNWQKITTPFPLNAAAFPSFSTVWGVGANGQILHSVDAGRNWKTLTKGTQDLNAVFAFDVNHVWVGGNAGSLFRTRDAGTTWEVVDFNSHGAQITDIRFINLTEGYLAAGKLYRTTDGGQTWEPVFDQATRIAALPTGEVWTVAMPQGYPILFRQLSGAWQELSDSWEDRKLPGISVQFADATRGVLEVGNRRAWITLDSGQSWTRVEKLVTDEEIIQDGLDFRAALVGEGGAIMLVTGDASYLSYDGGNRWLKYAGQGIPNGTDYLWSERRGKLFDFNSAWWLGDNLFRLGE